MTSVASTVTLVPHLVPDLLPIGLLALAAALAAGGPAVLDRQRPGGREHGSGAAGRRRVLLLVVAVLGLGGLGGVLLSGTRLALGLVGLGALLGVLHLVGRARASAAATRRSERVLAVCESLASDLRAGQPPLSALTRATRTWPELAPVAVAGQLDADVPEALRALAARPGAEALRVLAASWQVAHRSGAGLAAAVGQTADALRDERATTRLVAAELASAYATARLMAVLPFGVLLLGSGVGGDPVGFLVGTPAGLACLGGGLTASWLGMMWLQRLADGVLRR